MGIQDMEALRYKVLETTYNLSIDSENGHVSVAILLSKITNLTNAELNQILKYLVGKNLIKGILADNTGFNYIIITSTGVDLVEFELKKKFEQNDRNEETSLDSNLKVFISHSSKDADVADVIIELLRASLNLSDEQIRCTSVDGYKLPVGADTNEQLRKEIFDTDVFIGLISYDSLDSAYVMFELGARWGSKKFFAPLLCPGIDVSVLKGPLSSLNVLNCNNSSQLHQFVINIGKELKLNPGNPAAYQKYIDKVLALPSRIEKLQKEPSSVEKPIMEKDALEWFKSLEPETLGKYHMLYWFPIHSHQEVLVDTYAYKLRNPHSFASHPIIKTLIENNVLQALNSPILCKLCLDFEVYQYLKKFTDKMDITFKDRYSNSFDSLFDEKAINID